MFADVAHQYFLYALSDGGIDVFFHHPVEVLWRDAELFGIIVGRVFLLVALVHQPDKQFDQFILPCGVVFHFCIFHGSDDGTSEVEQQHLEGAPQHLLSEDVPLVVKQSDNHFQSICYIRHLAYVDVYHRIAVPLHDIIGWKRRFVFKNVHQERFVHQYDVELYVLCGVQQLAVAVGQQVGIVACVQFIPFAIDAGQGAPAGGDVELVAVSEERGVNPFYFQKS